MERDSGGWLVVVTTAAPIDHLVHERTEARRGAVQSKSEKELAKEISLIRHACYNACGLQNPSQLEEAHGEKKKVLQDWLDVSSHEFYPAFTKNVLHLRAAARLLLLSLALVLSLMHLFSLSRSLAVKNASLDSFSLLLCYILC